MKNRILAEILCGILLLNITGCGTQTANEKFVQTSENISTADVQSDNKTSVDIPTEEPATVNVSETTEKETDVSRTESVTSDSTQNFARPSESKKQDANIQPSAPPKSTESASEPTTTANQKPVHTTKPPVQTTVPKETTTKAAESPTATKPAEQFDINYWISYAKNYAQSVGLRIERSAVDCWDNPISANAKNKYLERDIQNRLNRYAKDEDITDVWIWAEKAADNSYEIYIGYA